MPKRPQPPYEYDEHAPDVDLEQEDVRDSRGNRITPEAVDEIIEAIHGRHGVGRPSLTRPGQHSPQVAVRLPEALRAAAEARAKREGRTVSAIVREALERYLET